VDDPADLRERANELMQMATRLRVIQLALAAAKDLEERAGELLARAEAIERKKKDKS
jgi:hypothetical protein